MKTDAVMRALGATTRVPSSVLRARTVSSCGKALTRPALTKRIYDDSVSVVRRSRVSVANAFAQEEEQDTLSEANSEAEYCMPAEIIVDNKKNQSFTVLTVEVQDFPGLVRVIAWVLNGVDVLVENATLQTDDDGIAHNTFWLTNSWGGKLSQKRAEFLVERLGDYITYCTPDDKELRATAWEQGPVSINNDESEKHTVVAVRLPRRKQTALLEIASTITGWASVFMKPLFRGAAGSRTSQFCHKNAMTSCGLTSSG
eukprot:jgi/Botrbrau1/1750/Bobra.0217s0008.1